MTEASFLLFGFACGCSEAPQFVEPVFFRDQNIWVQSAPAGSEVIEDFVEYNEDIEILELSSSETRQVGQTRMFAVRDVGDRIVCGDRTYVSKYLSQNLQNYLDKPYFLNDASRFSRTYLPYVYFMKTEKDLIEASALSGSLKRFCERELLTSKEFMINRSKIGTRSSEVAADSINNILHWSDDSTIFKKWLDFAEKDSPRLAYSSIWKHIDSNYRAVFPENTKNIGKYTFLYLAIAQDYVGRAPSHDNNLVNQLNMESTSLSSLKYYFVKSRGDRTMRHLIRRTGKFRHVEDVMQPTGRLTRIANFIRARIIGSIEEKRISTIELSMSVFFLNLVLKFTIQKLDQK